MSCVKVIEIFCVTDVGILKWGTFELYSLKNESGILKFLSEMYLIV